MKYSWLIYSLLMVCASGCRTNGINYPAGGYDYLKETTASDSDYYYLPIRKMIPLMDSMRYANEKYFFKAFHEPNISIEPAEEDMFRLSIDGFSVTSTVITLTEKRLIIKQTKKNQGNIYLVEDYDLLTETEKQHYFFLDKFFPFGKRTYTHGRQLYIDSMIASEPKLSDVNYYRYLINKARDKSAPAFEYSTREIPLTTVQFKAFAEAINTSGYWTLPYSPEVIDDAVTDGWGFCLEANTKDKYNVVTCNGIVKTKGTVQFKKACQQIFDFAGIADLEIWNPNLEK